MKNGSSLSQSLSIRLRGCVRPLRVPVNRACAFGSEGHCHQRRLELRLTFDNAGRTNSQPFHPPVRPAGRQSPVFFFISQQQNAHIRRSGPSYPRNVRTTTTGLAPKLCKSYRTAGRSPGGSGLLCVCTDHLEALGGVHPRNGLSIIIDTATDRSAVSFGERGKHTPCILIRLTSWGLVEKRLRNLLSGWLVLQCALTET